MINLDELNEINETIVLTAMGDQLMKESCYVCNFSDPEVFTESSKVNFFRRAIDFLNRIVVKFIAWIKKGQLKKLREKLMKYLNDPKRNNFYQDDDDNIREFYTKSYSFIFLRKELNPTVKSFLNLDLVKLIEDGSNIKGFNRSNLDNDISKLLKAEKKFKQVIAKMSGEGPTKIDRVNANMVRSSMKGVIDYIDLAINDVYENLNRCYKAIQVVQKNEKEMKLNDSKNVSQQYTRAMTIMGECFLHIMTITQKVAALYVSGSSKRAGSKKDKEIGYKELTVKDIYTELAKEFDDNDKAEANGVHLGITKLDDEHFRVEIYFKIFNANTWSKSTHYIPCKQITNAARSYIKAHSRPATAIKRSDIT